MKKIWVTYALRFSVLLINSLNDLLLSIIPCLPCDCLNSSFLQTSYSMLLLVIPSPADDLYAHPRKKMLPSQNPLDEIFILQIYLLPPIPTYGQIH